MKRADYSFQAYIRWLVTFLFTFTFGLNVAFAQVDTPNVVVTDDTTNYYSKYEISYTISNGNSNSLNPSENDSVVVIFNSSTTLPSTISPSEITIEGVNPSTSSDIVITNQRLAVKTPVLVDGRGSSTDRTVNIVIAKSAEIRNPSTSGGYTVQGLTSEEPTPVTSNTYQIYQSNTKISKPSVTPNPSVAFRSAEYTVAFQVGKAGYLNVGDNIQLTFPSGSTVPEGSISGVTLNGTSASAVGDSTTKVVDITTPVSIDNNGSVSIVFGEGAGLKNPDTGTGYTLTASTDSEPTAVTSSGYNISDPENLSFSSITLANDTVNATSQYQIDFIVGNTASALSVTNNDRIEIHFYPYTKVPSSIAANNITVVNQTDGFSNNPSSVTVNDMTDSVLVSFPTPVDIENEDEVRVIFDKNAGIQNTALSGSNYLRARTTESDGTTDINELTISNAFATTSTTSRTSQSSVTLSNSAAGQTSDYTVKFDVGKYGRLVADTSKVLLTFPSGTDLSTITGITINGTSAPDTTISGTDLSVTLPSTENVSNNGSVSLVVSGVTNPAENTYSLEVSTSVESSTVLSQSYEISNSQISVTSSTIGTTNVNSTSSFSFGLSGSSKLTSNDNDFVELTFPTGTIVPTGIVPGDVSIGNQTVSSVAVDSANRILKIYVGSNNKAATSVTVNASAGITQPAVVASTYDVLIGTSLDAPGSSPTYSLSGNTTSVTAGTVNATPSTQGATDVEYTIPFTTGANGKLQGGTAYGSSTITVRFNNPTTSTIVPASMAATDVTINGVNSGGVSISGDEVTITLPDDLTIDNSTSATIVFAGSAGLDNANNTNTHTVSVKTSSETTYSTETDNLTLTASVDLAFNSLSRSSDIVNSSTSYTIKFTTGTSQNLESGTDSIMVTFPENVHIPSTVSKEYVRINGAKPSVNPTTQRQELQILTPVNISGEEQVTVQISETAGLLNPTPVASDYQITVETTKEKDALAVQSTDYSTKEATSTVSSADVSLGDSGPGNTTNYTISLNTGTYGRLIESGGSLTASTIAIAFPSGTGYPGTINATVNGTSTAPASLSGDVITVTLPSLPADSIWNSDNIDLVIQGITNPNSAGDYTVDVKTSVETSFITSSSYPITTAQPLSTSNFSLTTNEVNEAGDYAFDFTVDATANNLNADAGTITITFPESSEIPSSISVSDILVENKSSGSGQLAASAISTDPSNRKVTITTPVTITAGQTGAIAIATTANIVNAKEPSTDYSLTVKTSTQPVNSSTSAFTILESSTTTITNLGVSVSPQSSTDPVKWTWGFRTGSKGALKSGEASIYFFFDNSDMSEVPDPMPTTAVSVNGVQVSTVEYPFNSDSARVRIVVPSSVTITNNDSVTVVFGSAAGIKVDPNLEKSKSTANTGSQTLAANNYSADTSAEGGDTSTSNPLPITLTSFKADIPEGTEEPVIHWSTATERENFGFYIDRTFVAQLENGKTKAFADTNWTEIHFMEGAGTTTQRTNYEFKDETVTQAGVYLYRIRQVDNDGQETFYGPIELRYEAPEQFKLNQNYPNPFNPTTKIEYSVAQQSNVRIDVYNILGQRVQTLVNREQLAGTYNVQFDGKALASGVYLVRMMANGNVFTKKMMLMK
ncbi:MAG: T9SS type A sorting domain-containing protein [Bacteroidota bacterium]